MPVYFVGKFKTAADEFMNPLIKYLLITLWQIWDNENQWKKAPAAYHNEAYFQIIRS